MAKEEKKEMRVGFVGFSGAKFDEEKAKELIVQAFNKLEEDFEDAELVIVSGLTDMGIPALVYREAATRGYNTVGVACKQAEDCEVYPVDESIIYGKDWGDESEVFLDMLDAFVRVGGGPQSKKELKMAKEKDLPIYEYDLEEIKNEDN